MSGAPSFHVERIEPLTFTGPDFLSTHDLMSPFVWRLADGRFGLLLRVVRDSLDEEGSSGSIWYGEGDDGLCFHVEETPVLTPDVGGCDERGCEDPTLTVVGDEMIVFYSGVDVAGDGHLLWALGKDVRSLVKRGVAHASTDAERNVKEAEIVRGPHGKWLIGFEYADGEASRIGYAEGDGPTGPWHPTKPGIGPRADRFDSWHLSPGPMLLDDPDHPVMFYNGATRDGDWAIGWAEFDLIGDATPHRCEEALVTASEPRDGRRMAFAASLVADDEKVQLYLSINDRTCHRATVARIGRPDDLRPPAA